MTLDTKGLQYCQMSAERYCIIFERLKQNLKLKGDSCYHAPTCPKTRQDCIILIDFRTDELKSKYASPEDMEQESALKQLEKKRNLTSSN